MPRLRHVAIASQDPDKTAKYFVDVFAMQIRGKIDSRNANGYYLSDGTINIAILKFKNQPAAGVPLDFEGLHHIGFEVEDIDATVERCKAAGYDPRHDVNIAQGLGANPSKDNAEFKLTGPNGLMIDVSQKGWVGASSTAEKAKA
ncbi:MAG TPA: VOC family protein [Steroidobacteraceae bacterium]|nr:VOC family protein [Steroidobacteraceae bacterium]HRX87910.1 VOC family protein [Steroidobacteraceae bacterium]